MPAWKLNTALNVAGLKAFLKLETGVTREPMPNGQMPEPNGQQAQKLQAAKQRIKKQRQALKDREQEISRLREGPGWKDALSAGRLPDFAVIGGRKCGTSLFYHVLCQHPQVEAAAKKEVHYFDLHYYWEDEWYRSHFPPFTEREGRKVLTGEASPYYIFHPHAARRMAEVAPRTKLIALLRDPVDRAYSHYHHEVRRYREPLSTFEEAIEAEEGRLRGELEAMLKRENYVSANHAHFSYLSRSVYIDQLENWGKFFDKDQILVLKSEDFFERTQDVLKSVLDFLDLPEWSFEGPAPRINTGSYPPINPSTEERLRDYFEPYNQRLYEYLGRDLGW